MTPYLLVGLGLVALTALVVVAVLPHLRNTAAATRTARSGRGRHHEDTVEIVAQTYMPPIGRRRIAAETDTQILKAVDE